MTCGENLARLFPLQYQRIVELAHEQRMEGILERPSRGRWGDLAGLFVWDSTKEGDDYWRALALGEDA